MSSFSTVAVSPSASTSPPPASSRSAAPLSALSAAALAAPTVPFSLSPPSLSRGAFGQAAQTGTKGLWPGSGALALAGKASVCTSPIERPRSASPADGAIHTGVWQAAGDEALDLDAASRHAAQIAPPPASNVAVLEPIAPMKTSAAAPPSSQPGVPMAPASLEDLMPGLVRKVAWSGDARNGTLRLELGSGALAGATLLVQSTAGRVDVTLGSSSGSSHTRGELDAWRDRIAARLEARGLDVGAIDVT